MGVDVANFPDNWTAGSLSDVCTRVQDAATPSSDGSRLYLGLEHIASGFPSFVGRGTEADVRSGKTAFRKGDILFGKLRPYLRKSAVVEDNGICSTDILVFRPTEKCLSEFLCYFTHTNEFIDYAKATTSGVQHPRTSWSSLREFKLYIPPMTEQRKIAGVLGVVQRAIEQQEQLLQRTTELKKTLRHHLFTHGLRGEPQKQTEIGLVPEGWEVVPLGNYLTKAQYGLSTKGTESGRYALLRMTNQQQGYISGDNLQFVALTQAQFERFRVERQDILFNRTNSLELVGRTAIFDIEGDFVFASYLIRLRTDAARLRPYFLNHYFNSDETQVRLKSIATRAVSQSNISATRLRSFVIPLPGLQEQNEMVAKIDCLDKKLTMHARKKLLLEDLFHTLLHELMTAQIRIDKLDISELELRRQ